MVKEIPLTQGKVALVDDEDYERLMLRKWYAQKRNDGNYVAAHKREKLVFMHRELSGAKKGELVDHEDRNSLNNQKYNLRIVTSFQSSCNTKARKNSTSKYKGVSWDKKTNRWRVVLQKNRKQIWIGYFDCEIEGAKAYDIVAIREFGEYAVTNFKERENV